MSFIIRTNNSGKIFPQAAVADPGGAEGAMAPPCPVKIGHKKMAAKGGRIDFMFLGPPSLTRPLDPLLSS